MPRWPALSCLPHCACCSEDQGWNGGEHPWRSLRVYSDIGVWSSSLLLETGAYQLESKPVLKNQLSHPLKKTSVWLYHWLSFHKTLPVPFKKTKKCKPQSYISWRAFLAWWSWLISQNNNYFWNYQRHPVSFLCNLKNANLQVKKKLKLYLQSEH